MYAKPWIKEFTTNRHALMRNVGVADYKFPFASEVLPRSAGSAGIVRGVCR